MIRPLTSRSLTTAVLVVAAGLTVCGAGFAVATDSYGGKESNPSAGTAPSAKASRHCETIQGITEQTMTSGATGPLSPVPLHKAGDGLVYSDTIYDAHNDVIGHAVGLAVGIYTRPSDGHLVAEYREVVELPGGTISTEGVIDRTAIFTGATAHFTAVGTSGTYLGMTGTREWTLTKVPPVPSTRTNDTIVMCR